MTKNKNLKPEPTYEPKPILVSKGQVNKMIDRLGTLQQDLISLADPLLCRTFLPQLQNYFNVLVRPVDKLQLRQMSDMISIIRELMLTRPVSKGEHFRPAKPKRT